MFLALGARIRSNTRELAAQEVMRNQRTLVDLRRRELADRIWTLSLLTDNTTLKAAIETYRVEGASAGRDVQGQLAATVQAEADRMLVDLGEDLLIVTDDQGGVIAAAATEGVGRGPPTDVSSWASVRQALDPAALLDTVGVSVAHVDSTWYQITSVPILLAGFTVGTLTLGERLDAAFVDRLHQMFRGQVAVAHPGGLVTTIPAVGPTDLADVLGSPAEEGPTPTLELGDEEFVVATVPMGRDQDDRGVTLYLLTSLTEAFRPIEAALLSSFFQYGLLAIVLAALGAAWASRSILEPLGRFVAFMTAVARTGRYAERFSVAGVPVEIASLGDAYDQLVASLTREQEELVARSEQLASANRELVRQIGEREQAERALRDSEEQLRQSQKLESLGTLAGGVAHDFNNILTVIASYTDLMLAGADPGSSAYADLTQVRDAVQRASGLTNQLLAFGRKQVLQPKVIDLNANVTSVEKMVRRLIGEHIEVRTVKSPALGRVKADPTQIEQVILNLAINARDAMPKGGTLTIETANAVLDADWVGRHGASPPGRYAMLAVSDTGVGMDEATRARIFEPFFTTKEPGKGTGLGLATVYGIVKQSGGSIWVYSELGMGSTFRVYFPLVDGVAPSVAGVEWRVVAGGTETILLVEDEPGVRGLASRVLQGSGYTTIVAASGVDALKAAAAHEGPIHLLLTDVVMPRMGGKELADALAGIRPDTLVLYMSGYTDDAIVHHGVLDSGTELLPKPFTPHELTARVRSVLDGVSKGLEAHVSRT
jgi:signal transduction histidine kinase/ActR/RegA family two-component response regulator